MDTMPTRAVEDCLIELFQALGIAQAHIAAGQLVPGDWLGLATGYPERVASLILVSPRPRSAIRSHDRSARRHLATDSPQEGTGFEPSVPRQEKWSMPSSSDQTRVGRTLRCERAARYRPVPLCQSSERGAVAPCRYWHWSN
jgi:pimeloyl-ACP methyl ester carboxylesterase